MLFFRILIFSICAISAFSVPAARAQPDSVSGIAIAVDGDTLWFAGAADGGEIVKVRLFGIDAPEMDAPGGPQARGALDDLTRGEVLRCAVEDIDRYHRLVAICRTTAAGTDIAEALLAGGWAWTYRRYLIGHPALDCYIAAETAARRAARGVWSK